MWLLGCAQLQQVVLEGVVAGRVGLFLTWRALNLFLVTVVIGLGSGAS